MKKFILLGLLTIATLVSYAADVGYREPVPKPLVEKDFTLVIPVMQVITMEVVDVAVEPVMAAMPISETKTAAVSPQMRAVSLRVIDSHKSKAPPKTTLNLNGWRQCTAPNPTIRHVYNI